jgi:hypothetical protein
LGHGNLVEETMARGAIKEGMILLLSAQQMLSKRRDPALAPTQSLIGSSMTRRLDSSYPDSLRKL